MALYIGKGGFAVGLGSLITCTIVREVQTTINTLAFANFEMA